MIGWKRLAPIALTLAVAGATTGCQEALKPTDNKQKLAQQWNSARAGVQVGLASQEYEAGDVENSRKNVEKAISMDPKLPGAWILSAKLQIEKGELDKAEQSLQQAQKLNAADPQADYYLGIVYQRWQKFDKALEQYSAAVTKAPGQLPYLLAKSEMLVALDRPDQALTALQEKVSFFESSPAIRDAVGQLLQSKGRYAESAVMFRQASILSPEDKTIRERLALSLYYAGDFQGSLDALTKLTADDNYAHRPDLMAAIGECQLELNHPREARAAFEVATQAAPAVVGNWLGLAKCALKANDLRRAESALRKAVALAPNNPEAHLMTGYLNLRQSRFPAALASFQKAAALDAGDTVGMCMVGYIQEKLGHADLALAQYAKALKAKPNDELATRLMASVDLHE